MTTFFKTFGWLSLFDIIIIWRVNFIVLLSKVIIFKISPKDKKKLNLSLKFFYFSVNFNGLKDKIIFIHFCNSQLTEKKGKDFIFSIFLNSTTPNCFKNFNHSQKCSNKLHLAPNCQFLFNWLISNCKFHKVINLFVLSIDSNPTIFLANPITNQNHISKNQTFLSKSKNIHYVVQMSS